MADWIIVSKKKPIGLLTQDEIAELRASGGKVYWSLSEGSEMVEILPEELIPRTAPLPQGDRLPDDTPQYTFEEIRSYSYALADMSTGQYYTPCEKDPNHGMPSMLYKRPGERFEIKFDPNGLPGDLRTGLKLDTIEAMENFMRQRGFRSTLTDQLLTQAAILKTDEPIALDHFVNKLFDPRTAKDRQEARVWMWDTIRAILALKLYGERAGVYKEPNTKKPIGMEFRGEPLIALSPGARKFVTEQHTQWPDSSIPVTLGFTMGAWGKEMKKNPAAIISYFGCLDDVLKIPGGKPAGAWARCILFNLNQRWREKAKDIIVTTYKRTDKDGNARYMTAVHWRQPVTRRKLLCELCPPDQAFSVMDILNGNTPKRAVKYWNAAVEILRTEGRIGHYKELDPLPKGIDGKPKRKGWQDDWLDQPLDIGPNEDGKKAAIEIKNSHQKVLTARKRKPKIGTQK